MAQSGLIIRRSVRHEIVLPAKFRVAPEHAESIRYVKGVGDADGWIGVDLVDFASGGAGFISTVYVPRGGVIELCLPAANPGEPPRLIVPRCRVVRVQMTDRRPAYLVGVAYLDADDATASGIDAMLALIEGDSD